LKTCISNKVQTKQERGNQVLNLDCEGLYKP
jgi:hypothetical protein